MSDAALVCVYRSTFIHTRGENSLKVVREAILDELRTRPHIPLDDDGHIEGYNSDDGYGTLRRGQSQGST